MSAVGILSNGCFSIFLALKSISEKSSSQRGLMPPGTNSRKIHLEFIMCRNDHQDILHFPEEPSTHMAVDEEDDLENQDPADTVKPPEGPESFSHIVAPEDMLVVPKDETVGEEVIASPQVSYEEIVHREEEGLAMEDPAEGGESRILLLLTQWTLTLQEVYQERSENESGLKKSGTKCICSKTSSLIKELEGLQSRLTEKRYNVPNRGEAVAPYVSEEKELHRIQTLIKAHVSIQISRPSDETVFQARRLVQDVEKPGQYLSALIRNLIGIIKDLLPCGSGRHFECTEGEYFLSEGGTLGGVMEQDEEEDMSLLVASMSTSPSKSSRKRKQTIKSKSPPSSPVCSSPSKKPRKGIGRSLEASGEGSSPSSPFRVRPFHKTNNVIDILEKNKKMAKTNGLYQFVLWREALKAEKDRVVHPSTPGKNHHKRLSFDL